MPCDGNEYLDSLDNYIDRKNIDYVRTRDLFNFLFRDPDYYRRVEIANKAIGVMDDDYKKHRDEIFAAMVNEGYESCVITYPFLVNSIPDRHKTVDRLSKKAIRLYKAVLGIIEEYGMGKTDVVPEFEVGGEDIPENPNKSCPSDCDYLYQ